MKIGFFEKVNKTTNEVENSMGRLVVFMITIGGLCLLVTSIVGFLFLECNVTPLLIAADSLLVTGVLGKSVQNKFESNGEK